MAAATVWRSLRALRYDPPGYAKKGARRTTFQAALEQSGQFMTAATGAGYATKPVQLFYGLSQAGRAIVAASPHIGNQAWKVGGHGLAANTGATNVADVTVTATTHGLFPAVAQALGVDALVPDERVPLRDLWPLVPEAMWAPLTSDALFPALAFLHDGWPDHTPFSKADVSWIPQAVRALHGDDRARLQEHFARYPALCGADIRMPSDTHSPWRAAGPRLEIRVAWRSGDPPILLADTKNLTDLQVALYRGPDDTVITPTVGSMTTALHPVLAWWCVLLALSSLARYEPASWAKMIDVDGSSESSAIEHILNEAAGVIPTAVKQILTSFRHDH